MTTPFLATTPRARVLIIFIILSNSDNEVTTLLVRPAPPSPDYAPASPDYSPDSDLDPDFLEDDSPGEVLTETVESLHTQTTLTSVAHPSSTGLLPTSPSFVRRPSKEIPMPSPSLLPSSSTLGVEIFDPTQNLT
nr:hypothetical protein [Tanacetum cinerariifolium]